MKFIEMSDDQLREMARKTDGMRATDWRNWSREMLLAFFHNRYRNGVVPDDQKF